MKRRNGFVLVCVLWVLAILTLVTVGFGRRALLDRRAATYSMDVSQARLMAHAAAERGIIEIRNKAFMDAILPKEQQGMTHLGQPWAQPKSLIKDGKYFDLGAGFDKDDVKFYIEDEESRVNVNTVPKSLLEGIECLKRPVMRRIWNRRTKEAHKGEGVVPFQAVEELRYLRGVDDDQWYGTQEEIGIKEIFTVNGDGKINVNTASKEVLLSIPKLGKRAVDALLGYRAGRDNTLYTADDTGFRSLEEVSQKTEIAGDALQAIQTYCKFTSNCFRITGIATRRGGTVRLQCSAVVWVSGSSANTGAWQEETFGS